jgi:5-methylcytosine-specific restriction endonuclease McrA
MAFVVEVDEAHVRRERERGRELRQTQWWKRRRASGICHHCGARVGARELTMDHLVPIIRGGRSTRGNVVPSCKPCNDAKRHSLVQEWEASRSSQER